MIRLEKKYVLYADADRLRFIKFLYKKGFKNIFKNRVNFSIYFDHKNLKFFYDSEEGLSYRTKIRLRVNKNKYINNYDEFDFEIKKSNPYFKKKISFKNNLDLKNSLHKLEKKIYEDQIISKKIIPILSTQYERSYYYSTKYGRVTIDKDLEYQTVYWDKFMKNFKFTRNKKDKRIVIENKIETKNLVDIDFIKLVPTRFSKYCEGVKFLNI